MELGNMFFGNSRGEYPVKRHAGFEDELWRLFKAIGADDHYGSDFISDVFEIHPYWWGDCTCGYEEKEHQWERLHNHRPPCLWYGYDGSKLMTAPCTCGYQHEREMFEMEHDHTETCALVRPNFWYKPDDYKLKWYKYPVRDSYTNRKLSLGQFVRMIDKCIASLKEKR